MKCGCVSVCGKITTQQKKLPTWINQLTINVFVLTNSISEVFSNTIALLTDYPKQYRIQSQDIIIYLYKLQ